MIAISYRREDSQPVAGRLYDRLQARFGKQNVFMDFDSIPPGVDFREQIKQTIERSNLVIAVIGPRWLGEQADSSRRIDDPTDFVRLELKYALEKGIPVIPLLVDDTLMPKPEKLPPEIKALAFRNALPLDSGIDFHTHAERLINGIYGLTDVGKMQDKDRAAIPMIAARSSRPLKTLLWGALAVAVATGVALFAWVQGTDQREETINKSRQILPTPQPTPVASAQPAQAPAAISNTPNVLAGTWEGDVYSIDPYMEGPLGVQQIRVYSPLRLVINAQNDVARTIFKEGEPIASDSSRWNRTGPWTLSTFNLSLTVHQDGRNATYREYRTETNGKSFQDENRGTLHKKN